MILLLLLAVHGFAQAVYDVDEDDRLDTDFRLNVKGMTAFPGLNIRGTVTAEAAGTASKHLQWGDVLAPCIRISLSI